MSKNTPGPWFWHNGDYERHAPSGIEVYARTTTGSRAVAKARTQHDGTERANARLIAAAPDLLAALAELVAEADEHPGWDGHPHANTLGFQMARDAIRKATEQEA